MKVHVVNHARFDYQVHAVGCVDIERQRKRRELNADWQMEVPSGTSVAEAVSLDISETMGWTEDSGEDRPWPVSAIRVCACLRKEATK